MVIIGVDPHPSSHTAVVLDALGRRLAQCTVPNDPAGWAPLKAWMERFPRAHWAVEGATSPFALPLARYLVAQGACLYPIHPSLTSQYRRRVERRKEDGRDAAHAAQALLANPQLPRYLPSEANLALQELTRRREQLGSVRKALRGSLGQLRVVLPGFAEQMQALLAALAQSLDWLDREIGRRVQQQAPGLLALPGIGPVLAGILLAEIGDIRRFPSAQHLASYAGAAPVYRGSGAVGRVCVNPGGNRRLNRALHLAVLTRIRLNKRGSRDYFLRKRQEGKTPWEALRLLKTYLAREVYRVLRAQYPA